MNYSLAEIRNGTGFERGARFVDAADFEAEQQTVIELRAVIASLHLTIEDARTSARAAWNSEQEAHNRMETAELYAELRDSMLDDARRACDDAECFMEGFEEETGDGNADAVREPLRKLRAVLNAEAAEKAPGAPGDVQAMREAIAARRRG